MKLTRLAGSCKTDECPTVSLTDRGTVAVRGVVIIDGDAHPGGDEAVVEIPLALLKEAARAAG